MKTILLREELYKRSNLYAAPSIDHEITLKTDFELCEDLKEFLFRAIRWQWVYNTIRFHSSLNTTPYKKLLEYCKIPKKIALFPVMILDEMVNILDVFFPKKDGYYVLTKDLSN